VETRYDELLRRLHEASRPDREPPEAARAYAEAVRQHAYRVTDADVERLLDGGMTEDEVFEATVAAAVGAGLARFDAAVRALG
jgi:alkylhydroperoxidase family enzyme